VDIQPFEISATSFAGRRLLAADRFSPCNLCGAESAGLLAPLKRRPSKSNASALRTAGIPAGFLPLLRICSGYESRSFAALLRAWGKRYESVRRDVSRLRRWEWGDLRRLAEWHNGDAKCGRDPSTAVGMTGFWGAARGEKSRQGCRRYEGLTAPAGGQRYVRRKAKEDPSLRSLRALGLAL